MSRDTRQKRDLHALNADGMVLCNPRDKEAAHRAEMEGIATEIGAVAVVLDRAEIGNARKVWARGGSGYE